MVVKLLALVLPLGLDTLAVAAAMGMAKVSPRRRLRLSLLFTTFEAGMPLIGLALGAPLGHVIGGAADYAAIVVLLALGLYALCSPQDGEAGEKLSRLGEMSGLRAIVLGVSISLDELAIGFTLGLLGLPTVLVVVLIAVQAFVAAQLGLRLGARLREPMRDAAERLAAVALTALGAFLLAEKVLA